MNELIITLKPDEKKPLYEQIYEYIKEEIQKGDLKANTKLPSTRRLANHLQVSRSTVNLSYEQLLSEGYIYAKAGSGYYVATIDSLLEIKEKQIESISIIKKEKENYFYDFSPRGVDLTSFPYNTWRKLSKEVLSGNYNELFANGITQGEENLRQAIADYLYAARGVKCHVDQIIIGAGSEYLLMLLNLIIGKEAVIAMENPTYKQAYRCFVSLGHKVVPIPLDKSGMNVEKLQESNVDIAYVMPSHQYPTGVIMPIKRRLELLTWAGGREERYIIEDDYDSEFRYKGKPIPSLYGVDSNEKVIYLGTFSRSIAPAIRISYMVLPPKLLHIYQKRNSFYSSTVSRIDQEILYHFIQDGYYERHLNKMRATYKNKHDCILSGLEPLKPYFKITGEHAGVHLLLESVCNKNEDWLVNQAKKQGVKVYGLSTYEIEKVEKTNGTVILGYANLTEKEIEEGLSCLRNAWMI